MLISKQWLGDYVSLDDVSNERLEELITTRVAEVDELHLSGSPLENAFAVKVVKVEPHPEREKLKVCEVHDGANSFSVVCGAPNVTEGIIVPFIAPGGVFAPKGVEGLLAVESREVNSVMSQGVLTSAAELQLYADHSGLLELADVKPGTKLSEIYGESDLVLEIDNKSLTHRPDLWCHFGFARELSAILNRPLIMDADKFGDDSESGAKLFKELGKGKAEWSVVIEEGSNCRRFAALEIRGVETIASPVWMQRRLFSVGAGVRNFLVDLSNYVMCDVGQPNHAYDLEALNGKTISARKGVQGEKFLGLDGIERHLSAEDIVIADEKEAVALGGVIGGELSSVQENTTSLLLECANFDPVVVRKMTKRHQLRTDASNRFEKSQSAHSVPVGMHRFVELLSAQFGDNLEVGGLSDSFVEKPKAISVPFSYEFIRKRLGVEVEDSKIEEILNGLHFKLESNGDELLADVPHFRATRDISVAEDLVEEIGRTYGYENIPEAAPLIKSTSPQKDSLKAQENQFRDELVAKGYSEVSNYSFMGVEDAQRKGYSIADAVELANSVSSEETLLRTSLVPGMIAAVEKNARFQSRFRLFELGRTYEKAASGLYSSFQAEKLGARNSGPGFERRMLSLALVEDKNEGKRSAELSPELESGGAFYSLVSDLKGIISRTYRLKLSLKPCQGGDSEVSSAACYGSLKNWMHPYRACSLICGEEEVGIVAESLPGFVEDLDGRAVFAEVDVERLCELVGPVTHFEAIPKYPASLFEMSVVMPKDTPFIELETLMRGSVDSAYLRDLEVLSVYSGKPLRENEKSISVKCWFGRADKTLENEELSNLQNAMMKAVNDSEFSLRS